MSACPRSVTQKQLKLNTIMLLSELQQKTDLTGKAGQVNKHLSTDGNNHIALTATMIPVGPWMQSTQPG